MQMLAKDQRYYRTKAWAARREAVLIRADHTCEYCQIRTATQVHHRTYDRFKKERISDLMAVCMVCHQYIHKLLVIGMIVDCRTGSLMERGDPGLGITEVWKKFLNNF